MRWITTALLILATLSGCFGGGDESEDPMETQQPGPDAMEPTPGLNVSLTASQSSGFAPLAINLSLDAELPENATALWQIQVYVTEDLLANRTADAAGNVTDAGNATDDGSPMETAPYLRFDGETLPASLNLTLDVGNYTVEAFVDADPDGNGTASLEIVVEEEPVVILPVLFFDGAENGEDQWTISSNVYYNPNLAGPDQELPAEHLTTWTITGDEAKTDASSWFSGYDDNYRTRMVSVPITIPDDGYKHVVSYQVKGGAEANNVDGLWVSWGPVDGELKNVAYHTEDINDWMSVRFPVSAGDIVLEFRFDSDISCSPRTPLIGVCGSGSFLGMWVDDIEVR